MMIVVDVRKEAVMAAFKGYPDRLQNALLRTMTRLAIGMQGYVKGSKLSGQVLHVRTGTLRRSINQEVIQEKNRITAIVGTNVKYGAVHEYGFHGAVNVKAYVRRSKSQLRSAIRTTKSGQSYYTRKGMHSGDINVRAHTRIMNLPERSFLRSALRDYEAKIHADLAKATAEVFK